MSHQATIALIVSVLFLATLIRSVFGFGEALIAVPLLALMVPVEVAAPVAVLASITVALIVVIQDWRNIHLDSAWRLVVASAFGIPLGVLLLRTVAEPVVKAILALVILCFSIYSFVNRKTVNRQSYVLQSDGPAWLFGFAAGILGGAYGMNGPPLVVYGTLRRWSPEQFRATLQGYFLPGSLMVLFGYGMSGLLTKTIGTYYAVALIPILLAVFLGRCIHQRINAERFRSYIQIFLAIIGIILLTQAVYGWNARAATQRPVASSVHAASIGNQAGIHLVAAERADVRDAEPLSGLGSRGLRRRR